DQLFARHGIEHEDDFRCLLATHRFARSNHGDRLVDSDDARQPLRAAPAGEEPDFHLWQADFGLRMASRHSIIEAERAFGAAAHARSINYGDGGIRQLLKAANHAETAFHHFAGLVGGSNRAAELFQIGAGDKHAGLAAAEDESFEVFFAFHRIKDLL